MPLWVVAVVVAAILMTTSAEAQTREFRLRGFADAGSTIFTAHESFDAVLGADGGTVFGGGGEVVLPQRVFVGVRASRFRRTGERVFLLGRERFGLGIPTTVTIVPVQFTGGYRFDYGWRVVPYAGLGAGLHRYTERSQFADGPENIEDQFAGYHVLGGAEFRLARWLSAAAEAQWATVPGALGGDPNSVAGAFGESNLGGTTLRVKLVVGR